MSKDKSDSRSTWEINVIQLNFLTMMDHMIFGYSPIWWLCISHAVRLHVPLVLLFSRIISNGSLLACSHVFKAMNDKIVINELDNGRYVIIYILNYSFLNNFWFLLLHTDKKYFVMKGCRYYLTNGAITNIFVSVVKKVNLSFFFFSFFFCHCYKETVKLCLPILSGKRNVILL